MTSHQAVKSFKKSSVPGVVITQFVDDIPEGCSTPDFERKPVTLTLQEGKNAIFRAVVKGVPTPDVKWTRLQGGMDDPAKYETFFNNVTNEFILQINRLTTDDSDLYRCFAVNEYGEAACSAGLRIIQVGFKRKAKYIPVHPADELKKQLQDFRKLLRKRAPAPRPKLLDKEAVWQLLLHADRRDYEKICMKYGIVDFRGMLRKLQEMRKDTESEQGELIHSVKNFQHIKVNKEGKATFSLELDLKNSNSKVYLLKDGKRLRYGMESEYRKHCLRRIGKRYNFIVNDVQPEDAGLYQVKVKDVPVFSTELDAESIPVRFEQLLSDVRCPEEEDAVFECILRTPCYDAVWLHKTHLLEESEKHQISVTPDGLTHQLIIKNIVPSDNGMYTLDTGLCSSNAWLIVEYAKGKRRQGEGGEREKSEWLKETLPDEDRAKKLRRREYVGDEDHLMDTGVEEDGWYRNGQGGSEGHSTDVDGSHRFLGKHRLRGAHRNGRTGFGQFSGADLDGDSMTYDGISFGLKGLGGKSGLRPFHGKDSMTGRADTGDELGGEGEWYSVDGRDDGMLDAVKIDMDDGEGVGSQLDKDGKLGDTSYRDGFGGVGRLGASDGSSVLDGLNPDSTGVGGGKGDLLSRTSPGTGARKNAAGTEIAGGMRSPYGKDGLPTVVDMNGASINREGQKGTPYGKDGLTIHASGHLGQAGRSGLQCGPGGLPAGDGAISGAGDSSIGEMEALYDPDGQPLGAGVGDAGVAGAGGFVSRYGKDGLPAGAGIGSAGAGGVGSPHGKDGLTAGAGLGGAGVAGAGGVWSPYGKDGLTPEAGFGGAAVGGFGGVGSPYGKDGLTAAAGVAGLGGVGSLFEKDGLPAGAGISGAGVAGAGGVGSPYGKDGLTAGAGLGGAGAGGVGFPYGKDGLPARSGLGGAGVAGAEGVGSPYGKDDLTAGAGIGGAGVAGAGGVGSLHGKNSLPAGAGVAGAGGFSSLYGKDGLPAGAGVGGSGVDGAEGIGSHHGKDGLPVGMGTGAGTGVAGFGGFGSPYGKDGLPAGAGAGVAGARGIVSFYGKDGLPTGAVTGAAHFPFGGEEVMGSHHGRDAMLSRAQAYMGGAGGDGFSSEGGGVSGSAILSAGSPYGKDSGSAGAKAGEGGVGRLGSDQRELHLVRGKEGVVGAVGRGGEYELDSHPGKSSMGDETGKGTASDFRGSGNRGSSHDRDSLSGQGDARGEGRDLGQLGSLYGKNSAFGGSGSKSRNRSVDGRNSGGFGQGSLDYGQMSDLYGGPPSINQRKQEPGVDIKANDFLKNTESMGKRRCYCLDDLKAPRCHLNKHLLDVRVLKGEPAELSCTVSKDEVTGTWFKDGLKLTSMDGIFFEKEGLVHKLIINKVEDIHAGKYRFEGGDIKTEASVFVEDPPQVDKVLLKNLSVPTVAKAGQKVKIKIPFEGRLPVRATWLKDRMELADDTRIRVDKTETFIMLSISSSERKDCGDYKVRLKNDSGVLEINFKLVVTDKPQPPAGPIKIVESTANDITIEWKPPKDDGGKPLQSYIVERQQVGENDWVTLGETPRSCTTFTTNKVEQDMSYYFRVRAVNAEGTSDALESDEVKAVSKASPGAPDPPKIVSASRDTITISWKAPCKTGSSQIVGYIVQKRKKGTVTWLPVNSVPIADKKLKMTNLKKGLQYEFRVAAVNAAGIGDASEPSQPVFARDSMESPGQVQDLKVSSSDSTSVTLTWKRPEAKDGSDVKGYDVEMRSSNNLNWTKCNTLPIEVTTYTVKGLQAKEMYFLRVRALNDSGPGEAAELEACIEAAPPVVSPRLLIDDTVKSLLVIKAGNTIRVNIPFEASPDPVVTWLKDGLPLPNQTTINTKDGTTQLLIGAAELTDSGTYTVELQNGLGKRETFSFQVQVTDIPQSPGPIQLEENVPNTVTVTWEPSASEKWENNLYYTVLKRESQKGLWHVVGDLIYTNKFTFTKLIPGRDYYFRVVAKNNLGASGPSESVQPWRIRKPKAEFQVKPQKYRRVNQNQPPRFLVPLKPHVVTTGSECRMSCAVGGHPPPKITWYKDNSDVSNDRTYFCTNDFGVCSLVVLGVTKHDEGEYMVEATNELGRASSKAFLTIKDSTL
ncbi:PREDICTED: immunoglobulin-like and fibronectin type III domain-containing protein 1 isoform X16 [Aptenodytes forsteri]|uniref:immunoglobulin-like and fibronectin type III domain-containing protein 1 isoform X16 n=1 Tax=Aptenodytes forsteri TaxID=9233 RepID=UPI00090526AB|nr:PREDICTED: immunoglobulin-like and fibronectin type III domain-containing protein 1 isoform X16 [Aptenodytes forsteri]